MGFFVLTYLYKNKKAVAKVKVVKNNNLDSNLNGTNFNNVTSQTIFSFGRFSVTSNFDRRIPIDYSDNLTSFVKTVTLDTIGVSDTESKIVYDYTTNAVLNLDKSDLNTFIRFGSGYEFLRVSIENIITNFKGSLFMNSQVSRNNATTYFDYNYDVITDTSTFSVHTNVIENTFGLVYNYGNTSIPDDNKLKNINLSYDKYVIWIPSRPDIISKVIGFTGNTSNTGINANLKFKVTGNPFSFISGTSSSLDFHLKPNNVVFEEFRMLLSQYERYIISERDGNDGFKFEIKDPTLLDDGSIIYSDTTLLWKTTDGYNIDINTPDYNKFLEILLTIGAKYDKIKTDLIARFLTPASLKAYDLTEEGKITKLLRIYGREFDQLRMFIDSLANINKVTYDKKNNIPDQLIKNMSRTFGWDYFSLVNEEELVNSFFSITEEERNLNTDLMPSEIDIELWRRILMNTSYFWKTKGTREALKAMFLLLGIPEPFINITEHVYTVDGKINPNTVPLSIEEFPTNSLPYDNDGYPAAPLETNDFYFQISGNTDSGQAYLDVFRMAGFNLTKTIDNKKSWIQTGSTIRVDDTTPQYYQEDSKLVINTKEIGISLDASRGVEYDVYEYIKKDFTINSPNYALPSYSFVNISMNFSGNENTFPLPASYESSNVGGDLEVRFNGILLNPPKTGTTDTSYEADYIVDNITKTFTLTNAVYAKYNSLKRDVVQATFVYSGSTSPVSGISAQYVVTRVRANPAGTIVPLPTYPRGDIQVTINGIALNKGTTQFNADYILDPNNTTGSSQIIIQNTDVISYLQVSPEIQVAYVEVFGSDDISARNEITRVDSFNSAKIYYNSSLNKYVYKLNYKVNNASNVKILIDGISLEPNVDYSINVQNKYEIFLPKGIRYGSIINVYYLVADNAYYNPMISNILVGGDEQIDDMSFLEFIIFMQKRLINARNRKTISDFKGGWYPTLLKIYIEYLKRGKLDDDDPLKSNGYSFYNLYLFLGKYNSFFQKFILQLLPATIIIMGNGEGGSEIRNTVFTKQKFMYRIGVNLFSDDSNNIDKRGREMIKYLGNDGSVFLIKQSSIT